jgi:uncharacterized membrane protein
MIIYFLQNPQVKRPNLTQIMTMVRGKLVGAVMRLFIFPQDTQEAPVERPNPTQLITKVRGNLVGAIM